MTSMVPRRSWPAVAALGAFDALLFVGAVLAVLGWRPGAALILAGVTGLIGAHLVVGIVLYRRVMRRPWPQVEPLDDDWDPPPGQSPPVTAVEPVRVPAPMGAIYLMLAVLAVAIAALAATDSGVVYIAVFAAGSALAFGWLVVHGMRTRRAVEERAEPGGRPPWVEVVWPGWTKRVVRAYVVLVVALTVVSAIALLVAVVWEAIRGP